MSKLNKCKLLEVGAGNLINRGVEQFLMNLCTNLEENIKVSVAVPGVCFNEELKKRVEETGGNIVAFDLMQKGKIPYFEFAKYLYREMRNNKYDVVEVQTGSIPVLGITCKIAKIAKVKTVIVHSQNTHEKNWKYSIQKIIFFPMIKQADYFWACSEKAGLDSFPKSVQKDVDMIPNGINGEKFAFDNARRNELREKMGLTNKFVIGNIGAFTKQKNHAFLLDVFGEVIKKNPDSILLLVGEGKLQEEIEKKIEKYGFSDKVILYGTTQNVNEILSVMDVFVFPSLWEGLGISVVEAQANGLPCICSSALPQEVMINSNLYFLDLSDSISEWVNKITSAERIAGDEAAKNVCESLFDIKRVSRKVMKIYISSKIKNS